MRKMAHTMTTCSVFNYYYYFICLSFMIFLTCCSAQDSNNNNSDISDNDNNNFLSSNVSRELFSILPVFPIFTDSDVVPVSEKCKNDSRIFQQQLTQFRLWAVKSKNNFLSLSLVKVIVVVVVVVAGVTYPCNFFFLYLNDAYNV